MNRKQKLLGRERWERFKEWEVFVYRMKRKRRVRRIWRSKGWTYYITVQKDEKKEEKVVKVNKYKKDVKDE